VEAFGREFAGTTVISAGRRNLEKASTPRLSTFGAALGHDEPNEDPSHYPIPCNRQLTSILRWEVV
jgi:hypothetical protein